MANADSRTHLVGSVPLAAAETVFRTVGSTLNPYLGRITDGETGKRGRWNWFQREMLPAHPYVEIDPDQPPFARYHWDGQLLRETPYFRVKPDVDPAADAFPTGYAEAALEAFGLYTLHFPSGRKELSRPKPSSRCGCPRPWLPLIGTSAPPLAKITCRPMTALCATPWRR